MLRNTMYLGGGSSNGINITITRGSGSTSSSRKIGYRPLGSTGEYTYFNIVAGTTTEYLEGDYELALEAYLNWNYDSRNFDVYYDGTKMPSTQFDTDDTGWYYRSVIEIYNGFDYTIKCTSTYSSSSQTERYDITTT